MKKSSKKLFKRTDIAYLLNKLYFISHSFTHRQCEIYIKATHMYFAYVPGTPLLPVEITAYTNLYCLANSFKLYFPELERFNSILDNYNAVNGR